MYLIFDTETTTFPSKDLLANHPNQARIVQLAWILLDEKFKERACFNSLIKLPVGVKISEGARNAHGISEEDCARYGCPMETAYHGWFNANACCQTRVAHNIKFDSQLIDIESKNLFLPSENNPPRQEFCTMEAMTPLCKLPFANGKRAWGGQKYKWPTLQEAHMFCFGNQFDGAHDALADVRATARIYRWLKEREQIAIDKQIVANLPFAKPQQYDTKVA